MWRFLSFSCFLSSLIYQWYSRWHIKGKHLWRQTGNLIIYMQKKCDLLSFQFCYLITKTHNRSTNIAQRSTLDVPYKCMHERMNDDKTITNFQLTLNCAYFSSSFSSICIKIWQLISRNSVNDHKFRCIFIFHVFRKFTFSVIRPALNSTLVKKKHDSYQRQRNKNELKQIITIKIWNMNSSPQPHGSIASTCLTTWKTGRFSLSRCFLCRSFAWHALNQNEWGRTKKKQIQRYLRLKISFHVRGDGVYVSKPINSIIYYDMYCTLHTTYANNPNWLYIF